MKRCGILCYFSDSFYKKFKKNSLNYYRFKKDLIHIAGELIYDDRRAAKEEDVDYLLRYNLSKHKG